MRSKVRGISQYEEKIISNMDGLLIISKLSKNDSEITNKNPLNLHNKALNNNNDNLRDIKGKSKTGLSQYQPAQLRGAPKVLKTPFMKLRPSEKSYHENSLNFIKSLNTIHQQNIYENANVTKDLLKHNYRRCKNVNHTFEHINSNPGLNNSLQETQH